MKTTKEYVMRKHFNENGDLVYLETENDLIRCKDCKWLDRDATSIGTFLSCNAVSNGGTKFFPEDDEWFCPKAERKEE